MTLGKAVLVMAATCGCAALVPALGARVAHTVKAPGRESERHAAPANKTPKKFQPARLQHGNTKLKEVALTFDDGPHPQYTPQLLRLLERYDIKATFFVVGKMAQQFPDLVKEEDAAGHIVGNHTFHHVNLTRIPQAEVQSEWQTCNQVVKEILGKQMRYCRPPGGDFDSNVVSAAERCCLTTVLWTDDPGDYASPGDNKIESRTLSRIRNGGIILLHDGIQQTIDVLPQIIDHLRRRGYKFVTVEEMERHLRKP